MNKSLFSIQDKPLGNAVVAWVAFQCTLPAKPTRLTEVPLMSLCLAQAGEYAGPDVARYLDGTLGIPFTAPLPILGDGCLAASSHLHLERYLLLYLHHITLRLLVCLRQHHEAPDQPHARLETPRALAPPTPTSTSTSSPVLVPLPPPATGTSRERVILHCSHSGRGSSSESFLRNLQSGTLAPVQALRRLSSCNSTAKGCPNLQHLLLSLLCTLNAALRFDSTFQSNHSTCRIPRATAAPLKCSATSSSPANFHLSTPFAVHDG
jgi:hypothetical protein